MQDAYGVLSRAAVKKSYDMTRRMAAEQAIKTAASLTRHAEAVRGENVLKNVEFSRPASAWTGTREKYRHETWQSLSLNIKKVCIPAIAVENIFFSSFFCFHRPKEQLRCTAFPAFLSSL